MIYDDQLYKKINYNKIYPIANEYLATSSVINTFPFMTKEFIYEQSDIKLFSYKRAKEKFGIQMHLFGSESAILQEMNGLYIIFYNHSEPDTRVRFSILHEYAHYILN
nr:ImmA/IrrE family metallo-endopeptidase [Lachnospiraceae bacterium]